MGNIECALMGNILSFVFVIPLFCLGVVLYVALIRCIWLFFVLAFFYSGAFCFLFPENGLPKSQA